MRLPIYVETNGDDHTAAVGALSFEICYFVTDNVAVSIGADVSLFDFGQTSATSFGLEPRVSYFFDSLDHMVPYAGVQGGYVYFDADSRGTNFDEDALTYGTLLGIDIPLNVYNFIRL